MSRSRGFMQLFLLGLGLTLVGVIRAQGQEREKDEVPVLRRGWPQDEEAKVAAEAAAKSRLSATHGMTPEEVAVAAGMRTRVFKVGDFFVSSQVGEERGKPFVEESLKAAGITFPKVAGAFYNPETGYLVVTNTLPNLAEVQQLVGTAGPPSATAVCAVTVIEGPGELIRQAQAASLEKGDAAASLAALLGYASHEGAKVRVVGDCRLESLSDKPAKVEAVCEYAFPQPLKLDAGSRVAEVPWETRQVGLRLEVDTRIGADLRTLETALTLELHPTLPSVRQSRVSDLGTGQVAEFPVAELNAVSFTSHYSVRSGSTRLVGIAKPSGQDGANEDTLWAAFATFTTHLPGNASRLLEPAEATPTPPATAPQPPPGMRTVLLPVPQGLVDPWRKDARPDKPAPPLEAWLIEQGIAFPPGASAEHTNDVLHVTNTPENIGGVVALLERTLASTYRTTAFTLHTFQAPAAFLRELAHRSTAAVDDAAMLAIVEEAVTRGEATCIDSLFLETKRDGIGIHEAGYEHSYVAKFSSDAKGRPALKLGRRHVGSSFKVEVTQQDHATTTFDYTHELHTAPPAQRRLRFQDPATQKAFELPVTDFHVARTSGVLALTSGTTRLLALHAPVGHAVAGPALLCATFLRAEAVPQASRFTNEAIAAAEEQRAKAAAKAREDPQAWETRTFYVPPDFLAGGSGTSDVHARKIFEAQGVQFPEGAVVSFNPKTATIFLKNTRQNLAIAEAFVRSILRFTPATLVISAHVLEGPGPLLRQLAAQACGKNDHRAELDALLAAVKDGSVRQVDMLHLEGRSGTHTTAGHGSEQTYLASVTTDEKGATVFGEETYQGGFRLEIEPTLGADGYVSAISLLADYTPSPPFEHREKITDTSGRPLEFPLTDHHRARVQTLTHIPHHHARLLHLWKPTGKPEFESGDVLQVLFITCDIKHG